MDSPLKYDENIVKEFGVKAEHELEPEQKLGYIRAQYDEIKKFLYRERTELILAEAQSTSKIEAIAADAKNKVASHRNNIRGIITSLSVLGTLVSELEAKLTK